jgi:hypothetical protein
MGATNGSNVAKEQRKRKEGTTATIGSYARTRLSARRPSATTATATTSKTRTSTATYNQTTIVKRKKEFAYGPKKAR